MGRVRLREEDVLRLCLEFLENRSLHISQLSLERETGVINGAYSDDLLFLRQLVLDGQWDDVLEFVQPLEALESFQAEKFRYLVLRAKYVELLCVKSEAGSSVESAIDEVVRVLGQLEKVAPSKEEYSNLCLLLPLPRLTDHTLYKDWNPSQARVRCFRDLFPLVEKFLSVEKKGRINEGWSRNDRLVQLLIKGLLYESCVGYCQAAATGGRLESDETGLGDLLDGSAALSDSDLSLLCWLRSVPKEVFSLPFEQKTLAVDVERLERPGLETSWTEHMLVRPIKPKTFPHSAMPFTRPRSAADLMSRSLMPGLEAASAAPPPPVSEDMTRSSFASFHLTGVKAGGKLMNTSVDLLFEHDPDVFLSSSYGRDPELPSLGEKSTVVSTPSTPDHKGRESPSSSTTTTARSSRRDSLSDKPASSTVDSGYDGDLYREYQRTKQRFTVDSLPRHQPLPPPSINDSSRSSSISARPPARLPNGTASDYQSSPAKVGTRGDADSTSGASGGSSNRPRFVPVTRLEDVQAVRCAEFHPSGKIYAVGSNSKTLRLCSYPKLNDIREEQGARQPNVIVKRTRHHKGSIYCMAWSPQGHLMATGSNDKTVKLISFNPDTSNFDSGKEMELTMHDGTVRDVCFIEDAVGKACLLVSGGAGDCKIYVTDCATGQTFQALSGHSGPVLSLHTWGGALFASGSQDRSVRLWDLRSRSCVSVISPPAGRGQGSPAAAVCVDPSGRLLVSGHEDASCVLYDVRGARSLQTFRPHQADVRSIRFSPSAYYLLTAGYDNRLVLTDLQGDLTMPLPSVVVACHQDKVISGRWHPSEFSFVSTSADKTAVLWALPPL